MAKTDGATVKARQQRPRKKRTYTQAPAAIDRGVPCRHCGEPYGHHVANTYPNGNRRVKCGKCGKPFVIRRVNAA